MSLTPKLSAQVNATLPPPGPSLSTDQDNTFGVPADSSSSVHPPEPQPLPQLYSNAGAGGGASAPTGAGGGTGSASNLTAVPTWLRTEPKRKWYTSCHSVVLLCRDTEAYLLVTLSN